MMQSIRGTLPGLLVVVVACGGSSPPSIGSPDGDASSDGVAMHDGSAGSDVVVGSEGGSRDSGVPSEGGSPPHDAGRDDDAEPSTLDAGGAGCGCDAGTEFCLHGDVTSTGGHDVYRCEPQIGDCPSCSCYLQVGVCMEEAVPKACSIGSGVFVVECAEIQ